jgi:hypothetical protein
MKPDPDLILFTAPCELQAADASQPARVQIVAYSGGIMTVPGFGPTIIDLSGLQAAESVTLLRDHDVSRVLGAARATITPRNVLLEGTISRKAHGLEVIDLAASWVGTISPPGVPGGGLRNFTTYGPRQRPEMALSRFISLASRGEAVEVFGDGSQTRSFCYVDDLVEGIYRLLMSDYTLPMNLGNPDEITIRQFG